MLELIGSVDFNVLKVIGMIISGVTGLIMSLVSKRSVNYRKIDKSIVLSAVLFFVYINLLSAVTTFVATVILVLFFENAFLAQMIVSLGFAILTIAIFWGLIVKTKRVKLMMVKAREVSKRMFWLINGISIFSVVIGFVYVPFVLLEIENGFTHAIIIVSWIATIWWFVAIVTFVWRTANYVFSTMEITLVDGEVIHHNCSPQMCRVHKHYLRLIERGEKGVILSERHINEASIKQIEYS